MIFLRIIFFSNPRMNKCTLTGFFKIPTIIVEYTFVFLLRTFLSSILTRTRTIEGKNRRFGNKHDGKTANIFYKYYGIVLCGREQAHTQAKACVDQFKVESRFTLGASVCVETYTNSYGVRRCHCEYWIQLLAGID